MSQNKTIALIGNPNVGKTSLFNLLTGAHQTVGNWPGVTVEYKKGVWQNGNTKYHIIDLPGIYSLSAYAPDEIVARDYLLNNHPDLVLNIVDASNLERNLYLTIQLLEMKVPLAIILSMTDVAEMNGLEIDIEHLKSHLGVPIYTGVLNRRLDNNNLYDFIETNLTSINLKNPVTYDPYIETQISALLNELDNVKLTFDRRWIAIKLLEHDAEQLQAIPRDYLSRIERYSKAIQKHRRQESQVAIAEDRYGYIKGLVLDVVTRKGKSNVTFSDRIDKVVLNRFIGLPIFFFVMYLVFLMAVRVSQPLIKLINWGFSIVFVDGLGRVYDYIAFPYWLKVFLSQGLGNGITTVATFIPPIFMIFFCLSVLEDSGYMSRAAFIADKSMRRIGLPGKAFIPLLVGFGCTVPAIMATRTLDSKRDRVMASMLTPFMSCGAKLPVYTYLSIIFFPKNADLVTFGLYLIGVVMALLTGYMLKKTIFKAEPGNFVMELPAYHIPTWNGIFLHTWHRLKDFILRASQTILGVIVLVNILALITVPNPWEKSRFDVNDDYQNRISVLEVGGKAITPVLSSMGITSNNWHAGVALITGLFAKEAIVGTLQSLYQQEGRRTEEIVLRHFPTWQQGFAYLLFILLYSPCAASLAVLWREHGWKWMGFAFLYLTVLAWICATLFYQISAFNINSMSIQWITVCIAVLCIGLVIIKLLGRKTANDSQKITP